MKKRSSNHSIDRFLLVTVLGWYYRDYYLYNDTRQHYLAWVRGWSEKEKACWEDKNFVHIPVVTRAMNVCLLEADGDLLRRNPGQTWARNPGAVLPESEEEAYRKLKKLMQLQYADEKERETLRQRVAACEDPGPKSDVGFQRKTVKNLVGELITLEERLEALGDDDLANWLAARVQGFRLRPVAGNAPVYHIEPVDQPDQQMAAVQAAYYPFLDKVSTQKVLELLGLTMQRRESLEDISGAEEKPDAPRDGPQGGLTRQLNLALAAVEDVWREYGDQETRELFWYELTYHSWQCHDGALTLTPRQQAIPMLPWQVVYSNGYFYLSGLRLDLPAEVTGGKLRDSKGKREPVLSNLRLDRIGDLHRVDPSGSDVDYSIKELRRLVEALYQSGYRAPMTYRDVSTIMYSGTPEPLVIDCDPTLLNGAVDDFGLQNIQQAEELPDGRVRLSIKGAVWGGARQWLLQHAGLCCLAPEPAQAEHRRELAQSLRRAARDYET